MSSSMARLRRLQRLGKKSPKDQSSNSEPSESQSGEQSTAGNGPADLRSRPPAFSSQRVRPELEDNLTANGLSALRSSLPLAEAVPGVDLKNAGGHCYGVAHAIPLADERGGAPLSELFNYDPTQLAAFHPNFNLTTAAQFRLAAFVDTETTGLGAGAGVYCFMVGIGRFESYPSQRELTQEVLWSTLDGTTHQFPTLDSNQSPTHFVVRQLFMRRPSEELALLTAVAELLASCSMTVTFNGRVFDLPLLRTRFQQNQHLLPEQSRVVPLLAPEQPHLDLLIPARRLWRRRLESCRLIWLEKHILAFERTGEDVPGHMIPLLYAQFVEAQVAASRSTGQDGEAGYMPSIFYHNQEDITSMVALTGQIYRLFGQIHHENAAQQAHAIDGLDWLSLGCCFEAIDEIEKAELAFTWALDLLGSDSQARRGRVEGYRRLSILYKRRGAWEEATTIWQQWLTTVSDDDPTPYIELAKYCEWQADDLEQAEMWTRWALHNLENSSRQVGKTVQLLGELNHRLARICRKRTGEKGVE